MKGSVESEIEFWVGIRNEIPLCCILFYESVWYPSLKKTIDEYARTMIKLTNNQGIIICPNCLIQKLKEKQKLRKNKIKIEIIKIS